MKQGKSHIMLWERSLASCKPVSQQGLAQPLSDCVIGVTQEFTQC
jgi:hypothetical protein